MEKRLRTVLMILASAFVLLACDPLDEPDETFTVDTLDDTVDANPGDGICRDATGSCSLRAAVMEGNANPNVTEILLVENQGYFLSTAGAGEDAAATGDLDLLASTHVRTPDGDAPAQVFGPFDDRVFDNHQGSHYFKNVFIRGDGTVSGADTHGGVIRHRSGVSTFVETWVAFGSTPGNGGAAYSDGGVLVFADSRISGNSADGGAGAIYGATGVVWLDKNVIVEDNTDDVGSLGQLHQNDGVLQVTSSSIFGENGIGISLDASASATIKHSHVWSGTACSGSGAITSVAPNIYSEESCGPVTGDFIELTLHLEPSGFNTHWFPNRIPIYTSGGFVDAIPAADCVSDHDVRGEPRAFGDGCEIGAIEVQQGESRGVDCVTPPVIEPFAQLQNCDLRNANLVGANLIGADLRYATASQNDLTGADLTDVDAREAFFWQVDISNANLTNADLTGADINDIDAANATFFNTVLANTESGSSRFGGATFTDVDATGSDMSRAKFLGATLTNIDFTGAVIFRTEWNDAVTRDLNFTNANLSRANFTGAELETVRFTNASLGIADFTDASVSTVSRGLDGADIRDATVTNADLSLIDTRGLLSVDLIGTPAQLPAGVGLAGGHIIGPGVNLFSFPLAGLDLSDLSITGADLRLTDLSGTDFSNTILDGVLMNGANASGANFTGVRFQGGGIMASDISFADFTNANLDGVNFGSPNTTGTIWSNTICPNGTNSDNQGGTC